HEEEHLDHGGEPARVEAFVGCEPRCSRPDECALLSARALLDDADVLRLRALGAGAGGVFHLVALVQALEARALDRAEMHEEVLAAVVRGDEAEALVTVEPLDRTCCHDAPSSMRRPRWTRSLATGRTLRGTPRLAQHTKTALRRFSGCLTLRFP